MEKFLQSIPSRKNQTANKCHRSPQTKKAVSPTKFSHHAIETNRNQPCTDPSTSKPKQNTARNRTAPASPPPAASPNLNTQAPPSSLRRGRALQRHGLGRRRRAAHAQRHPRARLIHTASSADSARRGHLDARPISLPRRAPPVAGVVVGAAGRLVVAVGQAREVVGQPGGRARDVGVLRRRRFERWRGRVAVEGWRLE